MPNLNLGVLESSVWKMELDDGRELHRTVKGMSPPLMLTITNKKAYLLWFIPGFNIASYSVGAPGAQLTPVLNH